ncbi:unnamed protein product [Anisakis simplex]|uniref:F-box domain-containing protein n=1 Tax=Anisakis simplex TaxID=6269 RepID=A0A0M3K6U8_ANISI|nr:unnamed protein product [Anisakis simplex]
MNDGLACSSQMSSDSSWINDPTAAASGRLSEQSSTNLQNDTILDATLLVDVVQMATVISPIAKVIELNEVCSDWHYWSSRALRHCDDLRLEVPCGNVQALTVQGSLMRSSHQAVSCVNYLLSRVECLRQLTICFLGPSVEMLNDVLDVLISSDKVQLEKITVSGRRGGLRVERIGRLMSKCASTLRFAGKVGISEFEEALQRDINLNLERLSLNNYDLYDEMNGMSRMNEEMSEAFSRITATQQPNKLRIRHLSLSAVESLRITQQTGGLFEGGSTRLPSAPLHNVTSFEVDQFPNRCHTPSEIRVVFPSIKHLLINSSLIPLRDLEHAFAYAAEWLTTFADIDLVGVLTAEVKHDCGDPQKADKIRCHIEDLERYGARIRVQSNENFSYPTHFIISNNAETFRLSVCCLCDLWLLSDITGVL